MRPPIPLSHLNGPPDPLAATIVAEGAAAIGEGSWDAPITLLISPVAFLGAAAVYGFVAGRSSETPPGDITAPAS